MRALLCLALLLPTPALADVIAAQSRVTAVTIYPQGAEVTREVVFTAPTGEHELVVLDIPSLVAAEGLRVTSPDVALGAFSLRDDRLPPREDALSPERVAAEEAVKVARVALHGAQGKVAGIKAEIEAQEAQIGFLTGVKVNDGATTAEAVSALSQMIGTEVLTARMAALAAAAQLPGAEEEVTQAEADLAQAQAALEALAQRDEQYQALSVAVTGTGAEGRLTITHYIYEASWSPVYDMALDRKAGRVSVSRGVLVTQYAEEDWLGVDLTLSTAQPGSQAEPTRLWPWLRRIADPVALDEMARDGAFIGGVAEPSMAPEAVMAEAVAPMTSAVAGFQGDTVIYRYPAKVDLASGVEDLRLKLDELTLPARVVAQAVPRADRTAFVVASVTNDSPEILLPGQVYLYRDGALVGGAQLTPWASGDELDLGFGAIEGIRLKRDMPERAEGDRGILATSTQIAESAVLEVQNLTAEPWPLRVLDMVPYSEQEELEITYTADPPVSEADVDGQRGILAWEFDLTPGETRAITLESLISWPEGKVLE